MDKIGKKINSTTEEALENCNKLMVLNPKSPTIFKLFGKFLKDILNEKEKGETCLNNFKSLVLKNFKFEDKDVI